MSSPPKPETGATNSPFARLLGLRLMQTGRGEAEVRMTVTDALRNSRGSLHGGALFSLIDTTLGQASHSLTDQAPGTVTLESKVNYIRPVSDGELVCLARVLSAGRRTQVLEARVEQDGKLIAVAQSTFMRV